MRLELQLVMQLRQEEKPWPSLRLNRNSSRLAAISTQRSHDILIICASQRPRPGGAVITVYVTEAYVCYTPIGSSSRWQLWIAKILSLAARLHDHKTLRWAITSFIADFWVHWYLYDYYLRSVNVSFSLVAGSTYTITEKPHRGERHFGQLFSFTSSFILFTDEFP